MSGYEELARDFNISSARAELGNKFESFVKQLLFGHCLQVQLEHFDPNLELGDHEEHVHRGGGQLKVKILLKLLASYQIVGIVEDGQQ